MKILNKLTYRYLKLNKKKSLITIISIVLMTTLIFSLGLGASTIRKKTVDRRSPAAPASRFRRIDAAPRAGTGGCFGARP